MKSGIIDINLAVNQNRLLEIFDAGSEGLWELMPGNVVKFYNTRFYENFEVTLHSSPLEEWVAIMHPDDVEQFKNNVNQQVTEKISYFASQYRIRNRQNEYRWIEAIGVLGTDEDGELQYLVGSHKDITEKKQHDEKLFQLAYQDTLTGLGNRRQLVEQLNVIQTESTPGTIITFGLSKFSQFVEVFGFESGNTLIKMCAEAISEVFPDTAMIFRSYSDEFVVMLKETPERASLCWTINQAITGFDQRFRAAHDTTIQRLSAGVYQLPGDPAATEDEESILYKSMLIMRYGKEHDSRIAFYADDEQRAIERHLFLETGIEKSIQDDEFYLMFQPIVCASTGKIKSVESLLRWHSACYGEINPGEFIGIAEANQDIIPLGYHVLHLVCSFIVQYRKAHQHDFKISVNISAIQLMQADFVQKFLAIVEQHQLSSAYLSIEVTESVVLETNAFAVQQLLTLNELGFSISLDDFGSGYSSLNTFFSIPFTQLKLDRCIVNKMAEDSSVFSYVKFLVAICQEKEITVIAEGIEDLAQADLVREAGVDLMQGYYFYRPMVGEKLMDLEI
ncbi:GGDEF domain-containing phosphodiesterase [Photobacterium sp. 1_MG-2023]|uniref:bifunctional diguanylate cyclase/phosphodiesterase n=1 Tax=Photobacterium sp. 1_MG-2023 TaxID=3062646 RepID=UPI0026E46F2D|nr:GGDEF domain-containing phosphodiesterase [Photobacterium sp. 1_MG-2023]MDO6708660.1 EAL domain-containing protein [Photobacterium sp. 1_MG-2023]